jgi:hypothetical protein
MEEHKQSPETFDINLENKVELSEYAKSIFSLLEEFVESHKNEFSDETIDTEIGYIKEFEKIKEGILGSKTKEDVIKSQEVLLEIINKNRPLHEKVEKLRLEVNDLNGKVKELKPESENDKILLSTFIDRMRNSATVLGSKVAELEDLKEEDIKYAISFKDNEGTVRTDWKNIFKILRSIFVRRDYLKEVVPLFRKLENTIAHKEEIVGTNGGDIAYGKNSFRWSNVEEAIRNVNLRDNFSADDIEGSMQKLGHPEWTEEVIKLKKDRYNKQDIENNMRNYLAKKLADTDFDHLKEPWERKLDQV